MPVNPLDTRVSVIMTPRESLDFLQKLAEDDNFRARFRRNPHKVFAEHHIYFPPEHVPDPVRLPPKAALKKILKRFRHRLEVDPPPPIPWIFMIFFSFYVEETGTTERE